MNFPTLLAQAENWREMGRDFRSDHLKLDPGLIVASLAVLVAVVIFLFVLARLMNRQEGRRIYNNPKQLFLGLCRAHELTSAQRRLLVQVARAENVVLPASLFLEPDRLTAAAANPSFRSQKAQLKALRETLFADLAGPAEKQPEPGMSVPG